MLYILYVYIVVVVAVVVLSGCSLLSVSLFDSFCILNVA